MSYLPKGLFASALCLFCSVFPLQAITFSQWQSTVFSAAELTNPAISGANANPTSDGNPNLFKYALGIDPHTASGPPASFSLSSNGPTLTFSELDGATDLLYHLSESPDLQHWVTPNNPTSTTVSDNGTIRTISLSDPNVPAPITKWFDRLRVVLSPDGSELLLAPDSFTASLNTPYSILLAWNDNAAIEEGYLIERNDGSDGTWQQIASTGPDINSFTDLSVAGGIDYTYRVSAFKGSNASDPSNEVPISISNVDSDGNGLPDWWELKYFGSIGQNPNALAPSGDGNTLLQDYALGLNPNDYYNGVLPSLSVVSGNGQTGSPGGLVPQPLIVSVMDASNNPIVGAPVQFAVGTGGGTLLASSIGTNTASITLITDNSGEAKAYYQLPAGTNAACTISCAATSGTNTESVSFTEYSDDGTGSYSSPFDASNVSANYNDDGSVDVSWVNNADPADTNATAIQYQDASGTWQTLTSVPAGVTSIHIPAR